MRSLARAIFAATCVLACQQPGTPSIDAIDPPHGLSDRETPVVLLGRNLEVPVEEDRGAVRAVAWSGDVGGIPLRKVESVSPERIRAVVPAGLRPGPHDVVVRAVGREARRLDGFLAIPAVPPRVDAVTPPELPSAGGTVRVTGAGFHPGTTVRVDGLDAPATRLDDGTLDVRAPPRAGGAVSIRLETPVGWVQRDDLLVYAPAL